MEDMESMGAQHAVAPVALEPILLPAKLFARGARMVVMLSDMTADAVVATTAVPPTPGSIVVLSRNGVRIPAAVAWVEGRSFALELDAPLSESRREQLLRIKRPGLSRPVPGRPELLAA